MATDAGSFPEVVDNEITGLIVPPRDSKALASALIRLLKDGELRKRMGDNGYKKLKTDLSWDKIAEKTTEVYRKAMKNGEAR